MTQRTRTTRSKPQLQPNFPPLQPISTLNTTKNNTTKHITTLSDDTLNTLVSPTHHLHTYHKQSHINTKPVTKVIVTTPTVLLRTDAELQHDAQYILSRQPKPKSYKKSLYTQSSMKPLTQSFYDAKSVPRQTLSLQKHKPYGQCECQQSINTVDLHTVDLQQSPTVHNMKRNYTEIEQYTKLLDQLQHSDQQLTQLMNSIELNQYNKTHRSNSDIIQQHNISVEHYARQLTALKHALGDCECCATVQQQQTHSSSNTNILHNNNKHDIEEHKQMDDLNDSYAETIDATQLQTNHIDVTVEQINDYDTIEPVRTIEYSIDTATPLKQTPSHSVRNTTDKQLIKNLIASGIKAKQNKDTVYNDNVGQQLTYPATDEIYS